MRRPIAGERPRNLPPGNLRAPAEWLAGRAKWAWGLILRTARVYGQEDCPTYAAAIAYYAIFSLVPLALITLSLFGLIVSDERIIDFVFDQLPLRETVSVRSNVEQIVNRAKDVSGAGLGIGLILLVWSSSGIFGAVRRGLNATVPMSRQRPFWHGKLIDLALVPVVGLLIVTAIVISTIVQLAVRRAGDIGPLDAGRSVDMATSVIAAAVSFGMFLLLYRYVPTRRPGWREAGTGAVLATILFEVAKNLYAFAFELTPFSRDTAVYAGFGTALTFLLWMFVNASILLLGAVVGRVVEEARRTGHKVGPGPDRELR
jgi:membrane protein